MWIKLKGANFSANNIGTLKSYKVDTTGLVGLNVNPKYVSYNTDGETISNVVFTFTVKSGYKFASGSTIKIGSDTKYTASSDLASGNTFTITMNVNSDIAFVGAAEKVETGGGSDEGGGGESTDPTPGDPPATGETVTFTLDTATTASTTEMVHTSQSIGSAVVYQEAGTRGVVTWDIPAYAIVTLTVATGGSYGMALTDRNNIVLASTPTANATDGTITFPIQTVPTRVHASKAKFTSGSYTTYSEEELKGMELSIGFTGAITGKYVNTSQTIGSPVVLIDMSSASYNISNSIPANTQVTITCKGTDAGGYGMALCDTSGNVIEYINHKNTASTDNKHTFTAQTVETKLYVSVNKFDSAIYTFV